ncbi:MAG: phosphonate ABC transporter, permease protein PhnE, partial [Methylibium sp.]|nr:phosphonate ABC transporter, permease protein PhnE [Methylibium sp.]
MSGTLAPSTAAAPAGPSPCWGCIALVLGLVAAVAASFAYLAVDYRQLFSNESMRLMAKFVGEFFPPDAAPAFLAKAAWGALQTFAVAAIGTLLAVGFGAAIALPAAGRFGLAPRLTARSLLNFLRSVPELVWA